MLRAWALVCLFALAACAPHAHHHHAGAEAACLLPGQKPMTVVELYFGREILGRATGVSDAEWASFAERVLAREFADGFSAFDAEGSWRDPASGRLVRERTKVVRIALPAGADAAPKARGAIDAYKAEFNQTSVGILSAPVCGAF
jgi:hypothetical protein